MPFPSPFFTPYYCECDVDYSHAFLYMYFPTYLYKFLGNMSYYFPCSKISYKYHPICILLQLAFFTNDLLQNFIHVDLYLQKTHFHNYIAFHDINTTLCPLSYEQALKLLPSFCSGKQCCFKHSCKGLFYTNAIDSLGIPRNGLAMCRRNSRQMRGIICYQIVLQS